MGEGASSQFHVVFVIKWKPQLYFLLLLLSLVCVSQSHLQLNYEVREFTWLYLNYLSGL